MRYPVPSFRATVYHGCTGHRKVFWLVSLCLLAEWAAAEYAAVWEDRRLDLRPSSYAIDWHQLAVDSSGEYRVFWTRPGTGSASKEIMVRRFNAQGVPLGAETTIRRIPSTAVCDIISSGYGTWAMVLAESSGRDTVLYIQRFGHDGSLRDAQPIRICSFSTNYNTYKAVIDRNEAVIVAVHKGTYSYRDPENLLRVWYLNRSGIADSIDVTPTVERWLRDLTVASDSRFTLFFGGLVIDMVNRGRVESRTYSYAANSLSAVSGFRLIHEAEADDAGAFVMAAGRCDSKGAVAVACVAPPMPQLELVILDSSGNIIPDGRVMLSHMYDYPAIVAGFNGAYMIAETDDYYRPAVVGTYRALIGLSRSPYAIPESTITLGSGTYPQFALDASRNVLFSHRHRAGRSVYLRRVGTDEIPEHRVNGIDESPLRVSVAIGAGGVHRFAAWTAAGADSVCVNGRSGSTYRAPNDSVTWYVSVPAGGSSAPFGLAARGDTVALAWIRGEGPAQASVRLAVWKAGDNVNLNQRTLGEGGVMAQNASVALGGGRCAVAWEQKSEAHGDTSWVHVQTCAADGSAPAAAVALSAGSNPHICAAGEGRFLVTFQYVRSITTQVGGIPVTRITSNVFGVFVSSETGRPASPIFRLNSRPDYAHEPRGVYVETSGQALGFWKEVAADLRTAKLFAVRASPTGSVVGQDWRCAPFDSSVGAYDVSADGDSLALVVWHSAANGRIWRQFVSAREGGVVSQADTVSSMVADPDVAVSVSVSVGDSAALVGWLSGSRLGRNRRQFLADYLVTEQGLSIAAHRSITGRSLRVSKLGYMAGPAEFSLLGRRVETCGAAARQSGVYLVRQPDGTLRRQIRVLAR